MFGSIFVFGFIFVVYLFGLFLFVCMMDFCGGCWDGFVFIVGG